MSSPLYGDKTGGARSQEYTMSRMVIVAGLLFFAVAPRAAEIGPELYHLKGAFDGQGGVTVSKNCYATMHQTGAQGRVQFEFLMSEMVVSSFERETLEHDRADLRHKLIIVHLTCESGRECIRRTQKDNPEPNEPEGGMVLVFSAEEGRIFAHAFGRVVRTCQIVGRLPVR